MARQCARAEKRAGARRHLGRRRPAHHGRPTRRIPLPAYPLTTDEAADRTLRTLEKRQIRQVLQETGGNKMEAARQLGIGTKTLYRKIQEYGL
ncbi:helix-turn-helix domain-containing protein [Hymenobacter sp. 5516J-16]|uniref:helix-turn-helix domain-containing protein n=1 Tax=Hymenobacter sp. 5516J-16 TaxID=2932253 RepID=UPI00293E079D|nr:helix-turn-helix domain-containing protein [Hymenobacter sp. 5516J-16]